MLKRTVCFRVLILLTFITSMFHLTAQHSGNEKISVFYEQAPLFKGMAYNGAMRIRIYVPPGKDVSYRSIHFSLDNEALKAIEKLGVLAREDKEAAFLSTATVLATAKPSTNLVNIPVKLNCQPGLNYIWISAVLKDKADIDKKIKLQVTGLTTSSGSKVSIIKSVNSSGNASDYLYRMGIAIRKAGDDNVNTYRIPGIATTDKGTLIAVYDVRYKNSQDLPGNIDVGMSRSVDGGRTWQSMKIIMDMGAPQENNGIGDPSILFDPVTKKLWVAALWSKGNRSIAGSEPGLSPDTTGQFVLVSSEDDGHTWSQPVNITSQVKNSIWHIYFQGPGNGIVMQNGTLVFPSQYWDETRKPGIPHSSIIYSTDQGNTWKSGVGAKSNTTESQVVETTPGTLMLNMRDNRGSYRSIATTTDMGKSWVEHYTSQEALPDPVCMASIIKANMRIKGKKQNVLFFSNMATQSIRENATIKASLDLGESWLPANQLLIDTRKTYGYSALTKIDDNYTGLLYEGNGEIYFIRIPVGDIIK